MYIQDIKLLAGELEDGQTYRGVCPKCQRKDTFTATRTGEGVVYNCYSTNCDLPAGVIGSKGHVPRLRESKNRVPKSFTGEIRGLTDEQKGFLRTRVGFDDRHLSLSQVKYAPVEDRYAYPIFGPAGSRRGWVLRSYEDRDARRKVITWLDVIEPHLSWYRRRDSNKLLIVEDIPSAVRAFFHFDGDVCAICGGSVGPDYIQEIVKHSKNLFWAMDEDNTIGAIKLSRRFSIFFESSRAVQLPCDLKDMTEQQIQEVFDRNGIRKKDSNSSN